MKQLIELGIVVLVAAFVGGFVAGLVGNQSVSLGGSSDSGWNATGSGCLAIDGTCVFDASGQLTVGASGDAAARINHGFCNIYADTGIAASSTEQVDCGSGSNGATALTGVASGDVCYVNFSKDAPNTGEGLRVTGVSASTTQGFITLDVSNGTGGAFTWTSTASTSLNYLCIDS